MADLAVVARWVLALCVAATLLAACGAPCNRTGSGWVPQKLFVTFAPSVTADQAGAIITSMGYEVDQLSSSGSRILARVTVPRGTECVAERRLGAHPDVISALQDTVLVL